MKPRFEDEKDMTTGEIKRYVRELKQEKKRREDEISEELERKAAIQEMRQLENELGIQVILGALPQ